MGAEKSSPMKPVCRQIASQPAIEAAHKLYSNLEHLANEDKSQMKKNSIVQQKILQPFGFYGTWSCMKFNFPGPPLRHGFFSTSSKKFIYLGFGKSHSGTFYQDLWHLNLQSYEWTQIPLSGQIPSSRKHACCSIYKNQLIVFGGVKNNVYDSSLYSIDLESGLCSRITTIGEHPSGVSGPLLCIDKNKLFVFGGVNSARPWALYVLDLETFEWHSKELEVDTRSHVPCVVVNHCMYAYGGSTEEGLLQIDLNREKGLIIPTMGISPPSQIHNGEMIVMDKFLLYYGGKFNASRTFLYALDMEKKWWFVFHAKPDGITTNVTDGKITDEGLFMLPRVHSFASGYSKEKREILAFFGSPAKRMRDISVFRMGKALSYLHLRDDMLSMLV